jgi:hypothetical protein
MFDGIADICAARVRKNHGFRKPRAAGPSERSILVAPAKAGRSTWKKKHLGEFLERAKGFEPSTPTLARLIQEITHDCPKLPVP